MPKGPLICGAIVLTMVVLVALLWCPVAWSGDADLDFCLFDCFANGAMKCLFMAKIIQIDQKRAEQSILDVHYVCALNGISVMFTEGTALGIVRDGCVIPYDDDVDCVILKEFRKEFLLKVLPELKSMGYRICKTWRKGNFVTLVKSGVYVDIDFISTDDFCQFGKQTPNPCPVSFIWSSGKFVDFHGHQLLCAGEEYLEYAYGDWKTPTHRLNY